MNEGQDFQEKKVGRSHSAPHGQAKERPSLGMDQSNAQSANEGPLKSRQRRHKKQIGKSDEGTAEAVMTESTKATERKDLSSSRRRKKQNTAPSQVDVTKPLDQDETKAAHQAHVSNASLNAPSRSPNEKATKNVDETMTSSDVQQRDTANEATTPGKSKKGFRAQRAPRKKEVSTVVDEKPNVQSAEAELSKPRRSRRGSQRKAAIKGFKEHDEKQSTDIAAGVDTGPINQHSIQLEESSQQTSTNALNTDDTEAKHRESTSNESQEVAETSSKSPTTTDKENGVRSKSSNDDDKPTSGTKLRTKNKARDKTRQSKPSTQAEAADNETSNEASGADSSKKETITCGDVAVNAKNEPSRTRTSKSIVYDEHLPLEAIQSGLDSGKFVVGNLRINKQNRQDGYVTVSGLDRDVHIDGIKNQNRALDGDTVVLSILPQRAWRTREVKAAISTSASISLAPSTNFSSTLQALWNPQIKAVEKAPKEAPVQAIELQEHILTLQARLKNSKMQPTAKVVHILKRSTEPYVGIIRVGKESALFDAFDKRLPRSIRIPIDDMPEKYRKTAKQFALSTLCLCRVTSWSPAHRSPNGTCVEVVGPAMSVESDIRALLATNNLLGHLKPFSKQIESSLPSSSNWKIPASELKVRRDLRDWTIFSIDPWTARDLDDAMSIRPLENDIFEIGVHIADVSYFIKEGTELDLEAQDRCTSVYLVNQVLPMLPRVLCEHLCSLNASVDRLAFSVLWHMRGDGSLVSDAPIWFGKTIIRSCCQMDYGTAQRILDGEESFEWPREPTGGHSKETIAKCVNDLGRIARARRSQRFASGAVQLHRPKLSFELDEAGNPIAMKEYPIRESNHLVEEFMLLANYLVAQHLLQHGPAVLRHHLPPEATKWENAWYHLEGCGFKMDPTTTLTQWLAQVGQQYGQVALKTVQHFLTKPMATAEYIIADQLTDYHRHFALNLPYYTHFTSPIRRYADVLVHRLLEKTLTGTSVKLEADVVDRCNAQKMNSKNAQQQCDKLFLTRYIKHTGEIETTATVVGVGARSFTVLLLAFGFEQRINAMDVATKFEFNDVSNVLHLTLSGGETLALALFAPVNVKLTTTNGLPLELVFRLCPPQPGL
ncbi:hypothetical protein AeRB84_002560 [Aphanomyces euteiches]|nr:hypothetical protein AeRB84_002560 [Aphanomyces euteiches]